jgi:hypothetical protein
MNAQPFLFSLFSPLFNGALLLLTGSDSQWCLFLLIASAYSISWCRGGVGSSAEVWVFSRWFCSIGVRIVLYHLLMQCRRRVVWWGMCYGFYPGGFVDSGSLCQYVHECYLLPVVKIWRFS